jgi:hypothetical protein
VANNDPWLGTTWKVYAVQGTGGSYLKPSGKQGVFTLSAVQDANGQTAYYTVYFASGDMPPCWQGLELFPHGSVQFPAPSPLLPPWTPSNDSLWLAAANAVRAGMNDSTARLEGTLNPDTNAATLTLVCVPNATTAGTPLLVLKLAAAAGAAIPFDDPGTGHGDH